MGKIIWTTVILFFCCTVSPAWADTRESCRLCGMYIDQYQQTAAYMTDRSGNRTATCGVADMIRMVDAAGGPDAFATIQVTDWASGDKINARNAIYVIGSDRIPDMIPNVIAFGQRAAADAFITAHGGAALSFTQALLSLSPMGMTMPGRLNTAVLPPPGATGMGVGYMSMEMDELMTGSNSIAFDTFVDRKINAKMPGMGPKRMTAKGPMYMLNLGLTEKLAAAVKTRYLKKEMVMQKRMTMMGKTTYSETTTRRSGMGDTELLLRYSLWRDAYYSKFVSLLGGLSLPTGRYDPAVRTMSGLQLGTDTLGYTAGLLGSARLADFWLHGELSHTIRPENSDNYDFGDITKIGLALHYTPNPDLMLGLETDYTDTAKNEMDGNKVANSGGVKANLAVVSSWRFLTALGGNFNLKLSAGIPYYEDVNAYGLGGRYFANMMLSFKRRIAR